MTTQTTAHTKGPWGRNIPPASKYTTKFLEMIPTIGFFLMLIGVADFVWCQVHIDRIEKCRHALSLANPNQLYREQDFPACRGL